MAVLELPTQPVPGLREMARRLSRHNVINGTIAMLFAVTGPLVILLSVGRGGGLSSADISSWVFAAYAVGGLFSLLFSFWYRQPIAIMWTIPGAVLVGNSLGHLSFAEVIGAYLASGVLILLLGVTGTVSRIMAAIPLPIVMGMVAGVFLPFALAIIEAFISVPLVATAMLAAFLATSRFAAVGRLLPPVLAALVAGAAMLPFITGPALSLPVSFELARPSLYWPVFSLQALAELTIPLAVTVIGIQNAQGFAILSQAGYRPAQNMLTSACGVGTLIFGAMGSVPTCVTGPANAILNTSGPKADRYLGGIVFGLLGIGFGVCAPFMAALGLALPLAYIAMLGGLAMLGVLQNAFVTAFRGGFTLGALTAFVVTVSGVTIFNVGAPFWGLVFGVVISVLLERGDFKRQRQVKD